MMMLLSGLCNYSLVKLNRKNQIAIRIINKSVKHDDKKSNMTLPTLAKEEFDICDFARIFCEILIVFAPTFRLAK